MNLNHLEKLVAPMTANFQTAQERLVGSEIPIITEINRHIQSKKGKQLRPLLTFLTARCCGMPDNLAENHPLFNAAAAIETLHTSTLIHDDVVDESDIRRGTATVNHRWGNKTAVLLGDYYLAVVMRAINDIDNKTLTHTINHTVIQMSEGELLQQQYCGNYDIDSSVYFQIIRKKTALFLASCCKTGALFATENPELLEAAYSFGENIGMAFQIRDDLLDFKPTALSGKPQGNDLKEHKCTLPLIFALQKTENRDIIIPILEKKEISDNDVSVISKIINNDNSIQKTSAILRDYLTKAELHLQYLPENKFREAMYDLANILQEI